MVNMMNKKIVIIITHENFNQLIGSQIIDLEEIEGTL